MGKVNKITIRVTDVELEKIEKLKMSFEKEMKGLKLTNSDIIRMALSAFEVEGRGGREEN